MNNDDTENILEMSFADLLNRSQKHTPSEPPTDDSDPVRVQRREAARRYLKRIGAILDDKGHLIAVRPL